MQLLNQAHDLFLKLLVSAMCVCVCDGTYGGKHWRWETLSNLANDYKFVKFYASTMQRVHTRVVIVNRHVQVVSRGQTAF